MKFKIIQILQLGLSFLLTAVEYFESHGLKEFIEETISSAINYWLPYIQISNLDIVTIEDDPNMIHEIKVSLTFIVTKTNSEQTITIFAGQDGIVRIE